MSKVEKLAVRELQKRVPGSKIMNIVEPPTTAGECAVCGATEPTYGDLGWEIIEIRFHIPNQDAVDAFAVTVCGPEHAPDGMQCAVDVIRSATSKALEKLQARGERGVG